VTTYLAPLLVVSTALCAVESSRPNQRVVNEADTGSKIKLDLGSTLAVRLAAQLGTGYSWQISERDAACLSEAEPARVEGPSKERPGSEQFQVFTFRALKPCQTRLELRYIRSWEKPPKASKVFSVEVEISKKEERR